MSDPLRLLHLTDLHLRDAIPGTAEIARRRSRAIPGLLDRLEAMLPALAPDAVVITGDLLHAPYGLYRGEDRFGVAALRPAVAADYRALKARFDRWGLPWLALPGNHDDERSFAEVFGPAGALDVKGFRLIAFHDREGAGHVPRRDADGMARFSAALADPTSPPQVHLQHYVLHPDIDDPYPHNYADRSSLLAAMAESGRVALSLAGHFHGGGGPARVGGVHHLVGRAFCEAPHTVALVSLHHDGRLDVMEIPLAETSGATTAPALISREHLLGVHAHFRDAAAIRARDDLGALIEAAQGRLLICAASLDREDLAGLDWPRLADAHDVLHAALREEGVVLDGLYYTTGRTNAEAAAAGLPRIACCGDGALAAALGRDFGISIDTLSWLSPR